ncbi:putative RNA methyltransferase [Bacillus sp. JCM 19041]|uniref:putative RNA methyltransferase n=1 Tax=Bacillus sp. JCM 19041 TaxID=1460637 RepID=UPI0006D1833B
MSKNKREKAADLAADLKMIFQCPHCGASVDIARGASMICENRHTFDFAKQGYINLLTSPMTSHYDAELFDARQKIIMESNLFDSLHEELLPIFKYQQGILLDVGCGEGSHLERLMQQCPNLDGVGLDIAKEGILKAAKSYVDSLWIVGDLAKSPFTEQAVDVILAILSPSNYKEFKRILKPQGTVVKVVPHENYLKELRSYFFSGENKQSYSNEQTVALFKEHFSDVETTRVTYTKQLSQEELPFLAQMTPLGWSSDKDKRKAFLQQDSLEVTIDLEILIGKKPF